VDDKEVIEPAAESFGAISAQEDYSVALEKMRSEFEAREQSLRDEIATLKQEIKSLLQSQL
jgi:hypothetical protein